MEEQWCIALGSGTDLASHVVSLLVTGLPPWCGVRGLGKANPSIPTCHCYLKFSQGCLTHL